MKTDKKINIPFSKQSLERWLKEGLKDIELSPGLSAEKAIKTILSGIELGIVVAQEQNQEKVGLSIDNIIKIANEVKPLLS